MPGGAVRLVLPALALLLLAAHLFRNGLIVLAAACLAAIALLFLRRAWAAVLLQAVLFIGTLEWIRTAWILASRRAAVGEPYGRLLAILGAIAAATVLAAIAVRARRRPHTGGRAR